MKTTFKKTISVLLSLLMLLSVFGGAGLQAFAAEERVMFLEADGSQRWVYDPIGMNDSTYELVGGEDGTRFSVVRYGNVAGSRGSVIPFFQNLIDKGEKELPITDLRMTRFWISLEQGVELVIKALEESKGGETFISKIPSFKITDLSEAMLPGCVKKEVGIREGEKLHEIMVTREDSLHTYEYEKHFIIYPHYNWWRDRDLIPGGKLVDQEFEYSSGTNTEWLSVEDLREKLKTDLDEH